MAGKRRGKVGDRFADAPFDGMRHLLMAPTKVSAKQAERFRVAAARAIARLDGMAEEEIDRLYPWPK